MATHMKLLVSLGNGDVKAFAVTLDNNGNETSSVELEDGKFDLNEMYAKTPLNHLGVLLYTRSSPGCVYYVGRKRYEAC